jgi:hypothetical protein
MFIMACCLAGGALLLVLILNALVAVDYRRNPVNRRARRILNARSPRASAING